VDVASIVGDIFKCEKTSFLVISRIISIKLNIKSSIIVPPCEPRFLAQMVQNHWRGKLLTFTPFLPRMHPMTPEITITPSEGDRKFKPIKVSVSEGALTAAAPAISLSGIGELPEVDKELTKLGKALADALRAL